ncbi:hypothetical protein HRW20_36465, partial [Streptomyces lunaelactis]|nr:hypothetical protein [Streptomyces lunaelactis]
VLGILLPYISVVIANAGRESAPSLPSTFVPAPSRPMIAPPAAGTESAEPFPEADAGPKSGEPDAPSGHQN